MRYQVRSIGLLPPKQPPPTQLSSTARSRLDALWARVRVPFDAADAEHAASLRALYALAFPDLPPLQEVRVSACHVCVSRLDGHANATQGVGCCLHTRR